MCNAYKSANKFNSLLKEISKNEKGAIEIFCANFERFIKCVAYTVTKSSTAIEEIVNDVLVNVWQFSHTGKRVRQPMAWLHTVTLHCALDKLKDEQAYCEIFDLPADDQAIENVHSKEVFCAYLDYLDENEQYIVILKILGDLSFKEISKSLKRPQSTVSSTFYRALDKLKEKIQ